MPARSRDGGQYDPFEVVDRLVADYPLIYLVDLDGVEHAEPQLDFLQELARDATLWVDGGVRTAEQAIDILVTGAQRAVLSSSTLQGPRELRRAWRLSTEFVFEIELTTDGVTSASTWEATDAVALATTVRGVGIDHIVISPREIDPDWGLVQTVAAGGPTWVDGSFSPAEVGPLRASGARGGIFHIDRLIGPNADEPTSAASERSNVVRDDET